MLSRYRDTQLRHNMATTHNKEHKQFDGDLKNNYFIIRNI